MSVVWTARVIENPPRASDAAVEAAERELGVCLPADYLAVARVHQGAMPVPNEIREGETITAVEKLYHFEARPSPSNIVNAWLDAANVLPRRVVPFAAASGGDYLCFDYRENPDEPAVAVMLHDHPTAPFRRLAGSFTEFVGLLV